MKTGRAPLRASALGNHLTTLEDVETEPIPFTIGDAETLVTNLVVTVVSSNQALLSKTNISLARARAARTLVAAPAPDQSGETTVTLTVTDLDNLSTNTSFRITVTPVNDPPT